MARTDTLLAKSGEPAESLRQHTERCLAVWRDLRIVYGGLPESLAEPTFFRLLFLATGLHDLGKAAAGFQHQLRTGQPWGYRHELLSAAFMNVLPLDDSVRRAIGYAVATHHRTVDELLQKYGTIFPFGKEQFERQRAELSENWHQIVDFLKWLEHLDRRFFTEDFARWTLPASPEDLVDPFANFVLPVKAELERGLLNSRRLLLLHLNGLLNAADHLASAGQDHLLPCVSDFRPLFRFRQLNEIQEAAFGLKGSALLTAPTGYGKTEAALLWAQANRGPEPGRRVYYVLPYTASINAMFQRLSKLVKNNEVVGIQHSRAGVFLHRLLQEANVGPESERQLIRHTQSLTRKIYRAYKITTPYQLIKGFFGGKHFELEVAAQAGSLFIYDEIHVYDARTTGLIVEMTSYLARKTGARFLIMSATLPNFLRQALKEATGADRLIHPPPEKLKNLFRHRIRVLNSGMPDVVDSIRADLSSGKRVLVVCNTVKQAQSMYKRLASEARSAALLHGRFIGHDRSRIEQRLDHVDLLVGTQTVEVSLDIDFDVLYTEPAPIDALLQRFGRVNRRNRQSEGAPVFVLSHGSEEDHYIYPPERVQHTLALLGQVDQLTEDLPQAFVDEVYSEGYIGKDAETYRKTRELFRDVILSLKPGLEEESYDDVLQQLFQGVQCVPECFRNKYEEALARKEIYVAEGYTLSLSLGQFHRLHKAGRAYRDKYQWFVNAPYHREYGLQPDAAEAEPLL